MPIANASSISDGIALWVLETACKQGRLWQRKGYNIRLGVNLSPSQLLSGDLAATVEAILRDTGFSPSLLELEVTENILLADDDGALKMFRRLQDLGVRIAFDDFGTGYASMTYLKKYPLDRLKIDKSFVRDLQANTDDAAIVRSTIGLGKAVGAVGDCRRHRGPCDSRVAAKHGLRRRAGLLFRSPDAGGGIRANVPDELRNLRRRHRTLQRPSTTGVTTGGVGTSRAPPPLY